MNNTKKNVMNALRTLSTAAARGARYIATVILLGLGLLMPAHAATPIVIDNTDASFTTTGTWPETIGADTITNINKNNNLNSSFLAHLLPPIHARILVSFFMCGAMAAYAVTRIMVDTANHRFG